MFCVCICVCVCLCLDHFRSTNDYDIYSLHVMLYCTMSMYCICVSMTIIENELIYNKQSKDKSFSFSLFQFFLWACTKSCENNPIYITSKPDISITVHCLVYVRFLIHFNSSIVQFFRKLISTSSPMKKIIF